MKLLALVLCFFVSFILTETASLSGLCLTVLEEVENFFYNSEILSAIGSHETLFGLMSYNEDLRKVFLNHSDKTKSELYEIAFKKFEDSLRATGEFDRPYSMRIYTAFQNFFLSQSPVFKQVEIFNNKSDSKEFPDLERMNSLGSIDLNNVGTLSFDFEENDFNGLSKDILTFMDETYSLPTVGSLLEVPSKFDGPEAKRAYDAESAAKKWTLAASKLSRFHLKIYTFVKGLPDRSLSSKFFAGTKINDNLKKIFTENAETKSPFYERSIADHFSLEVGKFVANLDVQDQNIVDLFIASIMEIGNEIYKEIKDEVKDPEPDADSFTQEFKRKRLETRTSPFNISHLSREPLDFFNHSIAESFKVDEEHFGIPSSTKSVNHSEDEEEVKEERIVDDEEDFINIATPEELDQPETVAILNDPFDALQDVITTKDLQQFDKIRSIYYGLVERDFENLGETGQLILGNILDEALTRVFKRK